ncbi:MAG: aminotransferase [Candidatus Levybacteria bacterium CG_4_9_14_0_2_um_filter_35_21]|nr:MAG: aminotransferase [Candidatus Levybacteria bacterium CG_4_9_14_0_2_um_filter_35_21]
MPISNKNSGKKLAINGGGRAVSIPRPHFIWPPKSNAAEKKELGDQRDKDISIKGSSGPIRELEDRFKSFLKNKVKYAITYNSGTSALLAAYFALGVDEGDEVISPAFTYHATVSPVFVLRGNPVLVDVDAETWCIDPSKIEEKITKKTKVIVVNHQWGHSADMDEILKIAKKYSLKILEDCSHAHGSKYKGRMVGTFGDIAVFSLQANKMLFAGEGGILVTNSSEYHDRATLFGHYRDRSRDEIKNKFYQQFWFTGYGLKLRMSPYNAITAIYSLQQLRNRIVSRKRCLKYFIEKLSQFSEITVPLIAEYADMGAWYGFKPLYNSGKFHNIPREKYIQTLAAEGVDVKEPQSDALSRLPLYTIKDDKMFRDRSRKHVFKAGDFPVAEKLASSALSLPTFTEWPESKKIIDQYVDAFQKVHDNYRELL